MSHLATLVKATRLLESLPFCGAALLGCLWVGVDDVCRIWPTVLLAMASALLLTAFAFTFNDIQDIEHDRISGSKSERPLVKGSLSVRSAWFISIGFLTVGNLLLALWAPWAALCVGLSTIPVSIAYSWRTCPFKTLPALSSVIHLIFGTQAFIVGAWSIGEANAASLAVGAFFGLVFAAGHLHHEVADVEADRSGGVRTHAVRYGPRPTLIAGFLLWCLSCVHFSALSLLHLGPAIWGWTQLGMFTCYLAGFFILLRGRTDPGRLGNLQTVYRIAYLSGGVLMAVAALLEPS
jgi:4-hydroxybenzoate polyprenyltransferase